MSKEAWIPCELHTHTIHSDGMHTLSQLAHSAKQKAITCMVLTDHNTISGHQEFAEVSEETDVLLIPGMEWTTFYGHVLLLGIRKYEDWRDWETKGFKDALKRVRSQGTLVGAAHPFRSGSPVCTGCFWDFGPDSWEELDFIEVWNGDFPSIRPENQRAYDWWTQLLNRGSKIVATSGRDWHRSDKEDKPVAVTYVKVAFNEKTSESAILNALKSGRATISMGPLLDMDVWANREHYQIGDVIQLDRTAESVKVSISIDFETRYGFWNFSTDTRLCRLASNLGEIQSNVVESHSQECAFMMDAANVEWVRAELYAIEGENKVLIGFTNPIYFQHI